MSAEHVLLEVKHVSKHFPHGLSWRERFVGAPRRVVRAVEDVTLEVTIGETLGIVGETGSGKTTFGRLVAGLTRPTEGTILFDGVAITEARGGSAQSIRRQVQMIFQDPYSSLDPRQTIASIIREPLDIHRVGTGPERERRVRLLMDQVALPGRYAARYPHELSGGLRQRAGIATALALSPRLIVADEPTSALDASVQAGIINLLGDLQKAMGVAFILISHNIDVVAHLSDRVAVMYLGRVVESGTVEDVFDNPQHPYTRALIASVPQMSRNAPLRRVELRGDIPSAMDISCGCPFRLRCWMQEDICATQAPPPYSYAAGHVATCHVTAREAGLAAAAATGRRTDSNSWL